MGERSRSTRVAKMEDAYLELLGVSFADMWKELSRHRQRRDTDNVLGVLSLWFLPTTLPSTLGAMSLSSQLQVSLHFSLLKLMWVEFLLPTLQGFLNIQHH